MSQKRAQSSGLGDASAYVGMGATFAAGIILFVAVGVLLDRWLGLTPMLTIVGTLVGSVLSFLRVYWRLEALARKERERRRLSR